MIKINIHDRITMLQEKLCQSQLDGALIINPVDLYYYSGSRQNALLWVPADAAPILLVRKSLTRAKQDSSLDDIRPFPRGKDLAAILGQAARRVGVLEDVMPVQHLKFYSRLLPEVDFCDISGINRELRSVKSVAELEVMKQAGDKLCSVFEQIPDFLRDGVREIDLSAEIEVRLRRLGGEGPVRMRAFNMELFGGLATCGASACAPGFFDGAVTGEGTSNAFPNGASEQLIMRDLPIMIDYTGIFDGYIVDMTRMFVIGQMPDEAQKAFDVALAIQAYVEENLQPGQICSALFEGACQLAEEHGLLHHFMGVAGEQAKFVGHGVGLELDEFPVLAKGFDVPLVERQTIAVEPKFILPGLGVVGIENTFAVGVDGGVRITRLKDDLVCV